MRKRIAALLSLACLALLPAAPPASASIPGYPAVPSVCLHAPTSLWWGTDVAGERADYINSPGHFCVRDPNIQPGYQFLAYYNTYGRLGFYRCAYGASRCVTLWYSGNWNDRTAQIVLAPNCQFYFTDDPFFFEWRNSSTRGECHMDMENYVTTGLTLELFDYDKSPARVWYRT